MFNLAQQQQQEQLQGEASEQRLAHASHRRHPMQGLTIDTGARESDHGSSSSVRSSLPSSDDDESYHDFQDYDLDTTIGAWDQITELTHEITSSLMAKQASILCQRFRRESTNLETGPPIKKRLVLLPSSVPVGLCNNKVIIDPDVTVVTSDDDDATNADKNDEPAVTPANNSNHDGGLPKNLYEHVDRIGRMSKLVMEIEYCQKQLRNEMLEMKQQE
jgi:hypothetical protein